jgi:cell division protease FtsH
MAEFEEAIDRVMAGPERKSRVISKKEREIIAYHEAGHALVASKIDGSDPVHKISIIPRGHMALGYTLQLPEEDRFLISKKELSDRITILLSGRVTEMLKFGDVTTGASNDLERATQIARQMVTEFGMSDRLGLVTLGRKQHEIFLGRDIMEDRNYSEEIAYAIDQEVRSMIDECFTRAKKILTEENERLEEITALLLEKEVLEGDELDELLGYPKKDHPASTAGSEDEGSEEEETEDNGSETEEEEDKKKQQEDKSSEDQDDDDPDEEEE